MDIHETQRFSEITTEIDVPVIQTNDQETFIRSGGHQQPLKLSRKRYARLCPLSIIDKEIGPLMEQLQYS